MKFIMAVLFLILTVFGSVVQSQDHCHDLSAIDSGSSKEGIRLNIQNSVSAEHADEAGSAALHICHLGHCSFVLESIVSFFSIGPKYLQVDRSSFFLISDFHSNLYRPPIS